MSAFDRVSNKNITKPRYTPQYNYERGTESITETTMIKSAISKWDPLSRIVQSYLGRNYS